MPAMARLRLLACDVDRTLLTHDHRLPNRVVAALAAAGEAGVKVILATARSPLAVRPYALRLGAADLAICFNGGWIGNVETGTVLEEHPIPRGDALAAMAAAADEKLDAMWFAGGVIHALRDGSAVRREAAVTGEPLAFAQTPDALPGLPGKIMCVTSSDGARERFISMKGRLGDRLEVVSSHPRLLEIGPKGVSKRRAIESVAAQLGLAGKECAAAGDAENDLEMLAWAGTAVTVGNAVAEAKRIARFVGPSCDEGGLAEGVAWLLDRKAQGSAAA